MARTKRSGRHLRGRRAGPPSGRHRGLRSDTRAGRRQLRREDALTYGFAGPELLKAVKLRAQKGAWLPNISPIGDQHAGHERNQRGNRICKRDGIAVDLRVPGHSSEDVANWVIETLPFDRIYLYGGDKPFHLSWSPEPIGQVIRMKLTERGFLYPRVERRGAPPPAEK